MNWLWAWQTQLLTDYWPIWATIILIAALGLILIYIDHHNGGGGTT